MILYAIYLIIFIAFVNSIINANKKGGYHSNWSTGIPNFKYSSKEFYQLLEKEMKSRNIPNLAIEEMNEKEGNVLSKSRIYLRIKWNQMDYYICAAPFADGFFVSWWLYMSETPFQKIVKEIPFVGLWLYRKLFVVTMYKMDTASMFMSYCQNAVLQSIEEITKGTGYRISETDRKPIMSDIFKR